MKYCAPPVKLMELLGINPVHSDWDLSDHETWQKIILPTGKIGDGYTESAVDYLIQRFPNHEKLTGFKRYHVAMGMVSRFNYDDIMHFITNDDVEWKFCMMNQRKLEFNLGIHMGWRLSGKTIQKIADDYGFVLDELQAA